jgi:hypothetical protein
MHSHAQFLGGVFNMLGRNAISNFESEDLLSDEIHILDVETTVFMWVGSDTR